MKYYAVAKGRVTGILTDWEKCKESISGFSGAIYKSFTSKSEAENFIRMNSIGHINNGKEAGKINLEWNGITDYKGSNHIKASNTVGDNTPTRYFTAGRNATNITQGAHLKDKVMIYVDGSYNNITNSIGSGIVILISNEIIKEGLKIKSPLYQLANNKYKEILKRFPSSEEAHSKHTGYAFNVKIKNKETLSRNVTGEVQATISSLELLSNLFITDLDKITLKDDILTVRIKHDYMGIQNNISGVWEKNKPESKIYYQLFKELMSVIAAKVNNIAVRFEHVDAHTGVYYNEVADILAGESAKKSSAEIPNPDKIPNSDLQIYDVSNVNNIKLLEYNSQYINNSNQELAYPYSTNLLFVKDLKYCVSKNQTVYFKEYR